ncbi:MAG: zinc-binding dehydrogenase [Gammaproteobacteria bacterium]|nr:zinc-binding dehydrogenase [Gammaproteobacteria bacterium]
MVEAVGDMVTYVKPGDHVITCLSAFCGHCEYCLTGTCPCARSRNSIAARKRNLAWATARRPWHQFLNLSSYAEMMLVHEHAIAKIREDMPLDRAALIGCGVTTGVGAVFHTAQVEPGTTVAVLGCGGIGLSAINGAAIAGASRIIAVDMLPSKLELARKFGATDVINAEGPGRGRRDQGDDRRRRALLVRGHRPEDRPRSRHSRCCVRVVPPPSSA